MATPTGRAQRRPSGSWKPVTRSSTRRAVPSVEAYEHQLGMAASAGIARVAATRRSGPRAAQRHHRVAGETRPERTRTDEGDAHGGAAGGKGGDRRHGLRGGRVALDARVAAKPDAVVLVPGHAVKGTCFDAAEVLRRKLEAEVVRTVVAREHLSRDRVPVEADRVAQARGEGRPTGLALRLVQHQDAAAAAIEGVIGTQVLVRAIAPNAEACIDAAIRSHPHGARVVPPPAREGRKQGQVPRIEALLAGPPGCAMEAGGAGDENFALAKRHAVRIVVQPDQHAGLPIGRRQAVHVPGA